MGDRCSVRISCRSADAPAVEAAMGAPCDGEVNSDGSTDLYFEGCNFGAQSELTGLAEQGIIFVGDCGPGDSYGESMFASWDKNLFEHDSSGGDLVLACDRVTGKPAPENRRYLKEFVEKHAAAFKFVTSGGGEGETEK